MLLFVFLLVSVIVCVPYNPTDPNVIAFGQSCALSGNSGDLGTQYSLGVREAFKEVNEMGGIYGGKYLQLQTLDDGYVPSQCRINTDTFLANSSIFSLIGYVGTPTSKAVTTSVINNETAYIGPLTGAKYLRQPFEQYMINIRAGYEDEASSMLHWAIRKKFRMRFSVLYQDDSFGKACLDAVNRTLVHYGLEVESTGTYVRNTIDTTQAYNDIGGSNGEPEVIFMAGTYKPLADFVKKVQDDAGGKYPVAKDDVLFIAFSFVGTVSFAETLKTNGANLKNVYVSEVVPNLKSSTSGYLDNYPVISKFKQRVTDPAKQTFKALEGYITGRSTVSMIQHMYGTDFSRTKFLSSVYSDRKFDVGGLLIGPYKQSECNQGLRQVFPVSIESGPSYKEVTTDEDIFSWKSCYSEEAYSQPMLYFKQSAPLTNVAGKLGLYFENGLKTALYEFNKVISISDRSVGLQTKDDEYNPTKTLSNTNTFLGQSSTFGFLGYVGTPTFSAIETKISQNMDKPFIGAFTGSNLLRKTTQTNILNIRSGYDEEIAAIVQNLVNKKVSKFAVLYQNDEFGTGCKNSLDAYLNQIGLSIGSNQATFERNSMAVDAAVTSIINNDPTQVLEGIVLIGTYAPLAKIIDLFVSTHSRTSLYFATVSFVGTISFRDELKTTYKSSLNGKGYDLSRILVSEVVPNFNDTNLKVVKNYKSVMSELGFIDDGSLGFVSFEGYIAGRFVSEVMKQFTTSQMNSLTGTQFLNKVYEMKTVNIDDLSLGPYSKEASSFCNNGMRSIWMTNLKDYNLVMENEDQPALTFPKTCRIDATTLKAPLFLGQSCNQTSLVFKDFSTALDLSLQQNYGQSGSKNVIVVQKNSNGLQATEISDTTYLRTTKLAKGLVGYKDTSCSSCPYYDKNTASNTVPFLAPMKSLFGPNLDEWKKSYYIRPYLFDEVYYLNEYFKSSGKNVHIMYQDDVTSGSSLKVFEHLYTILLDQKKLHKYTGDSSIAGLRTTINSGAFSDPNLVVIYLLDDMQPLREIMNGLTNKPFFAFTSGFDEAEYKSISGVTTRGYFVSSIFKRDTTSYTSFQSSSIFSKVGVYKDLAYYGYIVGKWVSDIQLSAQNYGQEFIPSILGKSTYTIEGSVTIGPFEDKFDEKHCNVGIRKLHIYDHTSTFKSTQNFQNTYCTLYGNIPLVSPPDNSGGDGDGKKSKKNDTGRVVGGIFGAIFSVGFVCCCLCCCGGCLVCCLLFGGGIVGGVYFFTSSDQGKEIVEKVKVTVGGVSGGSGSSGGKGVKLDDFKNDLTAGLHDIDETFAGDDLEDDFSIN